MNHALHDWLSDGERRPFSAPGLGFVVRSDRVYVVADGAVVVWAIHLDGVQSITDFVGAGSVLHLVADDLYYFRLETLTPCTIFEFRLSDFLNDRRRADLLLSHQTERNKALRLWMAYQLRPSVEDRLSGVLHLLAEQFGRPVASGIQIDLPLSHRILAAATGSSRATITRMLNKFVDSGRLHLVGARSGRRYCLPTTLEVRSAPCS